VLPGGWSPAFLGEFIVRLTANTQEQGSSYTVQMAFTVIPDPVATPTMTPIVPDPDISQDETTDISDIMLFALSYRTEHQSQNFQRNADFVTDGEIDAKDLLVFHSLYKNKKTQPTTVPVWLFAEIPVWEPGPAGYCDPTNQMMTIQFPENEITYGGGDEYDGIDSACVFPSFMQTIFHFSPIEGAVDYELTIRKADDDSLVKQFNIVEANRTQGEDAFSFGQTLQLNQMYTFVLRPIFAESGFGEPSEPLFIRLIQ
jgi:hypothetical protein